MGVIVIASVSFTKEIFKDKIISKQFVFLLENL